MKFSNISNQTWGGLRIALILVILSMNFGAYGTSTVYAAPPLNDDFLGATLITGISYTDTLDTTGATPTKSNPTTITPEPDNIGPCTDITTPADLHLNKGIHTVWYKYKPNVDESIGVDTIGSTFSPGVDLDTFVAVWTETGGNLTLETCNDSNYLGQTSQLSFLGKADVWYYFEVATFNCYFGNLNCGQQNGGNLIFNVNITNTNVSVGSDTKSHYMTSGNLVSDTFASTVNGPVKVINVTGDNIFTSQRAFYGNSFNELMGYPADQFTTEYWFPWYDNVYMQTWILVGNPSTTQTAYVDIYIGASKTSYSIPPGDRVTPQFPGKLDGPVRVVSTIGAGTPTPIPIFTSERSLYGTSFSEVMGYPADQFTTEYWFPWYDQVYMQTWILVGNPSASGTAYVDIYIGADKTSYSIPPNGRITPQFPNKLDGPVRVVSTSGAGTPTALPIFTSERSLYGTSFNEVMGYPSAQFTTDYWFTWYQNNTGGMTTWILVGNPSASQTAYVDIIIGGTTTSYSIPPNGRITPQFNVSNGPVHVVSKSGVGTPTAIPIFTSERALYGPSFNEMMGYPGNQLTSEYWFTWYDSVYMSTDLLVARP